MIKELLNDSGSNLIKMAALKEASLIQVKQGGTHSKRTETHFCKTSDVFQNLRISRDQH